MPDRDVVARGHSLQSLKWLMGSNVVLAVLAYRGLLTFQPRMYSARSRLSADAEQFLFTPTETAPLIIVLLALWLVYHRRAALFALPERSGSLWLVGPAFALGVSIYLWAVYTSAPDIQALSLICNLVGCLILWRGLPAVRIALVPILLLLFAVPLPSPIVAGWIWKFQLATAQLSGWMLYVIGIPHVVSGEMIYLPVDTYQVIESCSGLRSVQTLAMFSILMSDLFDRRRAHMACMFLASLPIGFLMNGLRVTTLILNPHSEIHTIHVAQGLAMLMGGLILLYLLDGVLGRLLGNAPRTWPAIPGAAAGQSPGEGASLPALPRVLAVSALVLFMLAVLYLFPVWTFRGQGGLSVDDAMARVTKGWEAREVRGPTNDLAKVSFRYTHRREYVPASTGAALTLQAAEQPVEVFVGVGEHLDRFKTPFSPKNAYPGRGWIVEDRGSLHLDGTEPEITWLQLRSGTHRVISYYWCEDYRGLVEESLRSFFALDRSPFARDLPVIVVRLSTEIEDDSAGQVQRARDRLAGFHALVARAIADLKAHMGADRKLETARLPNFHLWETFFPSGPLWDVKKPFWDRGLT